MTFLRVIPEFWRAVRVEGWYGALDVLAFWFLDDPYVPHRWFTGCSKPCGKYGHDEHVCPPCTQPHVFTGGWWTTVPATSTGQTIGISYCQTCHGYHAPGSCSTTIVYSNDA